VDDDDRRTPAASAWTMPAVSASSASRSGGTHQSRQRAGRRRAPVAACLVGAVVLLAGLGAAGPPTPVTTADVLPPADTSAIGATGRLPDPVPVPLPPGTPPLEGAPIPGEPTVSGSALGIPETVLAAYRAAATTVDRTAPGCRLTWPLVAGIGKVESGHASGGAVDADGTTRRPILGPQLTGTDGNAAIPDTDRGALDHDATWDRAVGPTQFIPSSWRIYGADGNGDGRADPDNVFDAGLATARYLCSSGGDLSGATARHDAVFRYNHSEDYVATVLSWADAYAAGALPVPDSTGTGDGDGGLADGGIVDGAPTLAALPSPSSRIPTAGGVPTAAAGSQLALPATPAGSMITTSGATRPSVAATRSPSSDLAPAPVGPVLPPSPAALTGPGVSAPKPASAATSTSATSTTASPSTPAPPATSTSTPPPAAPSSPAPKPAPSAPAPSKPAPTKPAPSRPAPTKPGSSTTTSSTTTSTTAPTSAARCTAALPAVARATGIPAAQLSAASAAGPGTGRTTCTVRGPRGPLLVAVTAAPGAPAPSTPTTGTSRTVAGGRTVLTVPASSGLPDDRARAALAAVAAAAAWG
jgi:hypothetical protein